MKRRNFIRLSLAAPLFLHASCRESAYKVNKKLVPPFDIAEPKTTLPVKDYKTIEVSGSYYDIGYQSGKKFRKNFHYILEHKKAWITKLIEITESQKGKAFRDELLAETKTYFPQYVDEIRGMSEGSGIDFNLMFSMSMKSELSAFEKENPGCSTVFYKDTQNSWLFHNEDGDATYYDQMYVLRATPPSGVSFTTLVYPGFIPGVGPSMNSEGIILTSNFIGCNKPMIGIPRYFLGRAILEAKNMEEALQIAQFERRAFPWHHNLASISDDKYVSIETLPDGTVDIREIDKGVYLHTNHTTGENTRDYEHQDLDYKNSSSISRMEVLTRLSAEYKEKKIDNPKIILDWMSSHEQAPYSPCRHPDGKITGQTLATAHFDIKKGIFRLYKGNPCIAVKDNLFVDYKY